MARSEENVTQGLVEGMGKPQGREGTCPSSSRKPERPGRLGGCRGKPSTTGTRSELEQEKAAAWQELSVGMQPRQECGGRRGSQPED